LFTRVEIGHIVIGADGQVIRRSCGFETEPTLVASRLKDRRHTVMDLTHQLVGRHRDDGEGAFPFSSARIAPVLPQAR